MNHWLKVYKEAKRLVTRNKIVLFTHSGVMIPNTEKRIASEVVYNCNNDVIHGLEIVGFYFVNQAGQAIYQQNLAYPISLNRGDCITLNLGDMTINDKWQIKDLIAEEDHI